MLSNKLEFEAQMRIAFHSTNPLLTRLPHCIFYNYGHPVQIIADMMKTPVGVWGDTCLVDVEGEPYLEPENGQVVEEFWFWTLPENQEYACQFTSKAGCFTMVIPANTSLNLLRKTYELADSKDEIFSYEKYISTIATLLPELGWAYIPLEYEHEYAIFVTAKENAHYVEEFREQLAVVGNTKVFNVTDTETGQRWNGPILWGT